MTRTGARQKLLPGAKQLCKLEFVAQSYELRIENGELRIVVFPSGMIEIIYMLSGNKKLSS